MQPNYIVPVAHVNVKDTDTNVYVSICMLTRNIHIFKYNEDMSICEFEVCESQAEASRFMALPLSRPSGYR
jgi:hypothetical protein